MLALLSNLKIMRAVTPFRAGLASLLVLSLAPCVARAQSIDHGSLELLFKEPVTTSATGSPQRVTNVPADMTIITAEDIERSGAFDLPTIISRVAGIDILNWAAGEADVGIRGYNQAYSTRLLVLIDGREVYATNFNYVSWSSLPVTLAEIRQIEVVRGSNSALFGFNAVGGVINIITFNPTYDNINSIEAHGGTQNDFGASVVQTLRLGDRVSMRLSAGGGRRDEWRNTADYPMAWEAHAMAAMSIQLAPQTVLSLEGTWARSVATEITPQQFTTASDHKANSFMATINSDTPYGEMQAQAYVNNNGELGYPGPLPPYNFKSQLSVVSLQDLFKIGTRNTIRLALEYRNSQQNTSPVDVGRVSYDVIAPSAMWDFAPTSRLSLNLAVRMDHMVLKRTGPAPPFVLYPNSDWDRSIDSFSANLGAVYRLDDLNTLRATYARGIQPPSLVELGGLQAVIVPGFLSLAGNPRLNPAVISNYQLSYDRSIPALNAKASAKAFFQQTDDIKGASDLTNPVFGPPGVGLVGGSENAANSTMAGFELAASGKIGGGFHWSADTTYTHVQERAINGNVLLTRNIQFDKMTPKFRGNIAAGWSGGRWAADAYVHYVTAYDAVVDPSGALLTTPAYVSLSGRISYRLSDGLTVALNGQNLGAARQLQGRVTGLQAPRRVMISLTKSW